MGYVRRIVKWDGGLHLIFDKDVEGSLIVVCLHIWECCLLITDQSDCYLFVVY